MRISLIVALAENGVIGRDGDLPWRLPDDLRHFKEVTMGKPVIMGRRTWTSLRRPLPGRRNIVVSRQPGLRLEGAEVASSLDAALRLLRDAEEVFVIGGAQIYAAVLPRAQRLHVTRVHAEVPGDTNFPAVAWAEWQCVQRRPHPADDRHAYAFTLEVWDRRA